MTSKQPNALILGMGFFCDPLKLGGPGPPGSLDIRRPFGGGRDAIEKESLMNDDDK